MKHIVSVLGLAVFVLLSAKAWADCTNPASVAGGVYYNTDVNALQFCNGTHWFNMGLVNPSATGTACTNPTAPEGSAYYNTTQNVVQFCNGDNWVVVGSQHFPSASGTACTTPAGDEGTMFFNTSVNKLQFCNGDNWVNATLLDPTAFYGIQGDKLLASDGAGGDKFGDSVFVDGAKVIIGASGNDDNGSSSGSAYIIDINTGNELHKLVPAGGAAVDKFGWSVSMSGNNAIIGAPYDDDNGSNSGSAYVFDVSTGGQLHHLLPSDGVADNNFGVSVSIDGDKAIVGASGDDDNGGASGSAYIFDVSTGVQLHKLLPTDGATSDQFGNSVSVDGGKAIVGAWGDDDNGSMSGSAYIFDVSTGTQLHKLTASDGAADDRFGHSVSISGDKAVVGAFVGDFGTGPGSAYIFDVNTGAELYKLSATDEVAGDRFGYSVSISGDKAVVGAYYDEDNGAGSGSAYVFDVSTGAQLQKLLPTDGVAYDSFGYSVSIDDAIVVVTSPSDDDNGSSSGSAYIFE